MLHKLLQLLTVSPFDNFNSLETYSVNALHGWPVVGL